MRSDPAERIALPDWLFTGAALELDVGCHKGLWLIEMARLHPGRNFLGIEHQAKRVERTMKKISHFKLPNAHVVRADGLEALRQLPVFSVDYVHVLFSDPWPKRRHETRRLVKEDFMQACARILKPQGRLRLVTDDVEYAASMRKLASSQPKFTVVTEERFYPATEFQKKFNEIGKPIHDLLLQKVS